MFRINMIECIQFMLKCVMYTSDNPPQYLARYLVEFSKVAEEQQVPWDFNETSSSFFFGGLWGLNHITET